VEPEAAAAPSGGTGDTFNVFLSKITSNDKKEQAAKLISEVKACPIEEARELAGRLIIPLLKDVAKADAESALNKFKSIKVTGRMTISRKK
jgi:ribosomal protein L7/L12